MNLSSPRELPLRGHRAGRNDVFRMSFAYPVAHRHLHVFLVNARFPALPLYLHVFLVTCMEMSFTVRIFV